MNKDPPEDLEHPNCCQHLLGVSQQQSGWEGSSKKVDLAGLAPFLQAAQPSFEKTENKRLTGEQGKKVLERNLFLQEAQWLVVKQTAVLLFPC